MAYFHKNILSIEKFSILIAGIRFGFVFCGFFGVATFGI